jgi:WD40 repeat protein
VAGPRLANYRKLLHHGGLRCSTTPRGRSDVCPADNRYLFAIDRADHTLRIDTKTGIIEPFADSRIRRIVWSPDGRFRCQIAGYHPQLIDTRTNQIMPIELPGDVPEAAWSPDGSLFAVMTWSGTIYFWDTKTWKNISRLNASPKGSWSFAFSPDGRSIAVGGSWGDIHLWHVATNRLLLTLQIPVSRITVMHVHFSPNCQTLAALVPIDEKHHVFLWNATSPQSAGV